MSEDKSLEDFFAKKKAKKGKTKSKFATSQAITQQVGSAKKEGEILKSKEQTSKKYSAASQTHTKKREEEWIDFEEPVEKDYTGLRIQALQISEKAEQEGNENNEQEEGEEDGDGPSKKDKFSPWQNAAASSAEVAPAAPVQEEAKPTGSYRPPGAYRPPGMRTRMAMSGGVKGKAPEIASEIAFPTLNAAVQASKSKDPTGSRSFEPVRHGSRTSENPVDRRPRLDLENKYDALYRS